jgi:hypothetical protein
MRLSRITSKSEFDRDELAAHIERCRALAKVQRNAVRKRVVEDLIRYLEGKFNEMGAPKLRSGHSADAEHFLPD